MPNYLMYYKPASDSDLVAVAFKIKDEELFGTASRDFVGLGLVHFSKPRSGCNEGKYSKGSDQARKERREENVRIQVLVHTVSSVPYVIKVESIAERR